MVSFNPLWAAGSAIGAGLFGKQLFNNGADDAEEDLNKIPGTIKPYFDPYINAGKNALGDLTGRYGQLMNDPNAIIAKLGSGYKQSPGYQWKLNQGEGAINNAAAAGGMLGTPQHEQQAGELAGHLADQDFQEYLNRVLGLFGQGLQGEEGINKLGYQGSSDLATNLAQALMSKSNLKYAGANNQNQQTGGLIGNVLSMFDFGGK